jgi:hypothetical protein
MATRPESLFNEAVEMGSVLVFTALLSSRVEKRLEAEFVRVECAIVRLSLGTKAEIDVALSKTAMKMSLVI